MKSDLAWVATGMAMKRQNMLELHCAKRACRQAIVDRDAAVKSYRSTARLLLSRLPHLNRYTTYQVKALERSDFVYLFLRDNLLDSLQQHRCSLHNLASCPPADAEPDGTPSGFGWHANHVQTRARWRPMGLHLAIHNMHPDHTPNPSHMDPHDPEPYGAPWRSVWPCKTFTQTTVKPRIDGAMVK